MDRGRGLTAASAPENPAKDHTQQYKLQRPAISAVRGQMADDDAREALQRMQLDEPAPAPAAAPPAGPQPAAQPLEAPFPPHHPGDQQQQQQLEPQQQQQQEPQQAQAQQPGASTSQPPDAAPRIVDVRDAAKRFWAHVRPGQLDYLHHLEATAPRRRLSSNAGPSLIQVGT